MHILHLELQGNGRSQAASCRCHSPVTGQIQLCCLAKVPVRHHTGSHLQWQQRPFPENWALFFVQGHAIRCVSIRKRQNEPSRCICWEHESAVSRGFSSEMTPPNFLLPLRPNDINICLNPLILHNHFKHKKEGGNYCCLRGGSWQATRTKPARLWLSQEASASFRRPQA